MKHIPIQLTKDEVTQLRRGGKIDYFYNGAAVRIEIIGPRKEVRNGAKAIPRVEQKG